MRGKSGRLSLRVTRPVVLALLFAFCARSSKAREAWESWSDCRLIENDSNDGDSFHVKAAGREYILRLYLVDAPENDSGFPERVAEQAKYFGISPDQSVQLGASAARFVEEKLAPSFKVRTRRQTAMGRSSAVRYYSFVEASEGDLGELLVANGLARVHGIAPAQDESYSPRDTKRRLQKLESEAKRLQVGGWGAASGRMNARVIAPGKQKIQDSFDRFFHPERGIASQPPSVVSPRALAVPRPAPLRTKGAALSPPGQLDANTATVTELVKLEGIGPVLAQRIVEARPFKTADELRRVKGIGPKKYARIRRHFAAAPK